MYSKEVLRIFSNPENAGKIIKAEGVADIYNEDKTANVEFFLQIENGLIKQCKFRAQANPEIIAICDKVASAVIGKPDNMILVDANAIAKQLSVSVEDVRFCIEGVSAALKKYKDKLAKAKK